MRHDFNRFEKAHPKVIATDKKQIPRTVPKKIECPIASKSYPIINNDLERDNVGNDLSASDLQQFH